MKTISIPFLIIAFLTLPFSKTQAQGSAEKIRFSDAQPSTIQIADSYTFNIDYVSHADSDITVEISGGPSKFFIHKKVKITKGQGSKTLIIESDKQPIPGKGYKIVLSLRSPNGNWQTTRAGQVMNNVEFVKQPVNNANHANFSSALPTIFESVKQYDIEVDYNFTKPTYMQVSLWEKNKWLASSKRTNMEAGSGKNTFSIMYDKPLEGSGYKFLLSYGSMEEYKNKTVVSNEITGIHFIEPLKKITIAEIHARSIQISINNASNILTIPGASTFDFINIIDRKGAILSEAKNTNSIDITNLPRGAYYAITSKDDYYLFLKS